MGMAGCGSGFYPVLPIGQVDCEGPVSYTHLDVYKRQGHDVTIIDKRATALQHTIESLDIMAIEGNGCLLYTSRCV